MDAPTETRGAENTWIDPAKAGHPNRCDTSTIWVDDKTPSKRGMIH